MIKYNLLLIIHWVHTPSLTLSHSLSDFFLTPFHPLSLFIQIGHIVCYHFFHSYWIYLHTNVHSDESQLQKTTSYDVSLHLFVSLLFSLTLFVSLLLSLSLSFSLFLSLLSVSLSFALSLSFSLSLCLSPPPSLCFSLSLSFSCPLLPPDHFFIYIWKCKISHHPHR